MAKDLIIRDNPILASKGVLNVKHFFNTLEERDLYYNNTNNKKELTKNETVVAIRTSTQNVSDFYMWTGENNPDTYEPIRFENINILVEGASGKDAYQLLYRWNNDKLEIKSADPLVTEWKSSTSLKGIEGDSIETGSISNGNDLVFGVRDNSNNSLKEVKIEGFIDTVKSTIVLGNYGGIKFYPSDNLTTIILPTTTHMEKGTWWKTAKAGYMGNTKVNINSIVIANKTTDNPVINDFDIFTGAIDEILANGLFILAKGNSNINEVKNFKMGVNDDGSLVLSIYDIITNTFKDVSTLGKLCIMDDLIIKEGGAIFLERTAPDGKKIKARVCGTATSDQSLSYGDPNFDTYILGKNPKITTVGVAGKNDVLQINPVFSSTKQMAKYSMTFPVGQTRSIKSVSAKIEDNIGDVLITCTNLTTNKLTYKSRDLLLFNNSLQKDYYLSGDVTFYSTEPFYILEGHTYRIDVAFSNTVGVKGVNKIYMGEINPTITIQWDIFAGAKAGHYWRISQDGNIDFGNGVIIPVVSGNILICMEDLTSVPNSFDSFSLENVNIPFGGLPLNFTPYMILNTDILEFDEIVGKKYLDSVLKGGSDGEVYVKGNSSTNNSVLITTNQNNNNQIEFKTLTNATNKTYSDAIIKDINLGGKYTSLIQTIDGLKAGRTPKGSFDPTVDTLSKLADAKVGYSWQVIKDGTVETKTLKTGETIVCIADVVGIPTGWTSFNIESAPTFSVFTPATITQNGLSGAVPTPMAGLQMWLNSLYGWSTLPVFEGYTTGMISPKTLGGTPTGKEFLCDDGFWKTIPNYIGSNGLTNGVSGLVPSATIAESNNALFGDGSWKPVLSSSSYNNFTNINNFMRTVNILTNDNNQLVINGTSGTPFSTSNIGSNNGLIVHNTTVGSLNSTSFVGAGSSGGIKSDFRWFNNTTGTSASTQNMTLDSNGCLVIGKTTSTNTNNFLEINGGMNLAKTNGTKGIVTQGDLYYDGTDLNFVNAKGNLALNASQYYCSLARQASLTLNVSTTYTIQFDATNKDPISMGTLNSNNAITIPATGWYRIEGQVSIASTGGAKVFTLSLLADNVAFAGHTLGYSAGNDVVQVSKSLYLNSGAKISMQIATQGSYNGTLNNTTSGGTWITCTRIN